MNSYNLDVDGNPVKCDMSEINWYNPWHLRDRVGDSVVSTVFVPIDHRSSLDYGPPVLFETLIFDGPKDGYIERYTSKSAAEKGHKMMVDELQSIKEKDNQND